MSLVKIEVRDRNSVNIIYDIKRRTVKNNGIQNKSQHVLYIIRYYI